MKLDLRLGKYYSNMHLLIQIKEENLLKKDESSTTNTHSNITKKNLLMKMTKL